MVYLDNIPELLLLSRQTEGSEVFSCFQKEPYVFPHQLQRQTPAILTVNPMPENSVASLSQPAQDICTAGTRSLLSLSHRPSDALLQSSKLLLLI